jgi:hypothetical protein
MFKPGQDPAFFNGLNFRDTPCHDREQVCLHAKENLALGWSRVSGDAVSDGCNAFDKPIKTSFCGSCSNSIERKK